MKYLKFGNSNNFLVFLHGWGADKNSFLWIKDYFPDYSTIFVDFPGFGESPEPERDYKVFDYVLKLKEILDDYYIEKLVVVGHSFGGRVAIKFSFMFQNDYLDYRVCLVDSAGLKPKRGLRYYYKIFKYKILKKINDNFSTPNNNLIDLSKYGSKDYISLSPTMKKTFKNIVNEDLTCYAKYIKVKTLIVWGSRDRETKLYMAKKLNKIIKNSTLKIIKDAGHFSFLDDKKQFMVILESYIK